LAPKSELISDALDIHDVRPFIGSKNFDISRDFYVTLGWTVEYDSEELRVLKLGNHSFYLQKYYNKAWCNNTMLHISVLDVDAWYAKGKDLFDRKALVKGRMMKDGIENRDYGRTFHVLDPSNVLLHFTQFHD